MQRFGTDGEIAENRLGMTAMKAHGAAYMAPFMPEPMARFGTQMHHAASRFVQAAEDAQHKVYRALQQVTQNCNGCHQAYRIR